MGEGAEGQAAVETRGSTELGPGGPGHHSCAPDGTCKLGVGAASHASLEGATALGVSISLSVTLAYKDGVLLVSWLLNIHQCLHPAHEGTNCILCHCARYLEAGTCCR